MIDARSLSESTIDVELLAQQVDPGFGDLLAHEDFRAFAHRLQP